MRASRQPGPSRESPTRSAPAAAQAGRAKRSVVRRMGTSLAQIARLPGTTNFRKSLDEMDRLLCCLGFRVEVSVERPDSGRAKRSPVVRSGAEARSRGSGTSVRRGRAG